MRKTLLLFGLFFLLAIPASAQRVVYQRAETVPAGKHYRIPYEFTRTTRLWGKFRATGGGRNDIQCLILDADGYENFQNGNQYRYYYNSGRVTVGTFNVSLRPGSYYLVFNNSWSILTPKAVTIWFYE